MIEPELRKRILASPESLLDDRDVMNALVAANERAMGPNVIDLRGIAMQRLETKLEKLEDTHRSVIAAAYENLAGANQVHRTILALLEPTDFEGFLTALDTVITAMLRVDGLRLVIESHAFGAACPDAETLQRFGAVLQIAEPGFIAASLSAAGKSAAQRPVQLRQLTTASPLLHGARAAAIRSEALLPLDLGSGRLPGLLVLGAEDPNLFHAAQGTDLLAFFGGVFERILRRWLA